MKVADMECRDCSYYFEDGGKAGETCHFPFGNLPEDLSGMEAPGCNPKDFFDAYNKQRIQNGKNLID